MEKYNQKELNWLKENNFFKGKYFYYHDLGYYTFIICGNKKFFITSDNQHHMPMCSLIGWELKDSWDKLHNKKNFKKCIKDAIRLLEKNREIK